MKKLMSENEWQKNYSMGQDYYFRNLCSSCIYQIPECPSKPGDERTRRIKYGDGIGRDNVRECSYYIEKD